MNQDDGDPTQPAPPEQLLAECERINAESKLIFQAARDFMNEGIDRLEQIAVRMARACNRMEILKQTMRPPPPPLPVKDDDRLCAGERAIIYSLATQGSAESVLELAKRTGYAESSLRTWLPMLRAKELVDGFGLTEKGLGWALDLFAENVRKVDDATPDVPTGELIKQVPGAPEDELS